MAVFLEKNRERIEKKYQELVKELPHIFAEVNEKMAGCDEDTALACKYLYNTMPYSDFGNYTFEIFLDYAEHGVWLWKNKEAVRALPETIFLNYVLAHRVNEEEVAPCRKLFFEKIGSRVEGLSLKEAALEVNFWCAEEATYHTTDERTLSALTVYRRGNGRCGEESVFTVNALRSVGIPARQVYAPRWSHCDDNHAWVEIWCDGEWYFLGACEPEMVLDKGWFTNASSRAMMIHSRFFDEEGAEGDIISRNGMVTELNELRRYALVKEISVNVKNEKGEPVSGAKVSFEVLNYSEYVTVAEKITDENGNVTLTTGLGSTHIFVTFEKDGLMAAEAFMDTRNEDSCSVVLKALEADNTWKAVDMIAPLDAPVNTNAPTPEQKEIGNKRFAKANAMREEKTRNWVNPECEAFLHKTVTDMEDSLGFPFREAMLEVLSEKDRTDCVSDILEEHLDYSMPYWDSVSRETFVSYIMNPRVDNEILRPYRKAILDKFSPDEQDVMRKNPVEIWNWVDKMIVSRPERERASVITTPAGCLKTGIGSFLSKKVLFVAIARTLGIPARLNPNDRSMEYMNTDDEFVAVLAKTEKNSRLILKETDGTEWKYFLNWSIARLENGKYTSLLLDDVVFENRALELKVESGSYRIITSNRLPNGNMFANQYEFEVGAGETKEVELVLRQANLDDMLENIAINEFTLKKEDGTDVNVSDLTRDGKHILAFLEEEKEPTEHILNEMMEQQEAFKKYASRIIFVVRSKEALSTPTLAKALGILGDEVQIYYDDFSEIINTLGRRMYVDPEKLPLIIVTNGELNGIYATSGYNVGTGDMLLRLM